MYRLAKKYWFNDFNAYRRLNPDSQRKVSTLLKKDLDKRTADRQSREAPIKPCHLEV